MSSWLCLLVLIAIVSANAETEKNVLRLEIVDNTSSSYFVRGKYPADIKGNFNLNLLQTELKKILPQTGKKKELHIISLMNHLTPRETKRRYSEELELSNRSEVEYETHFVIGTLINPESIPSILIKPIIFLQKIIDLDQINQLIAKIESLLQQKNKIVYVHCSQGIDRTGYVSTAYLMKAKEQSFITAFASSAIFLEEMKRPMFRNCWYGLRWFCLQLKRSIEECRY